MMMMSLLVGINSRLATNEQCVETLMTEKEARPQSLSPAPADPSTRRGTFRRGVTTGPRHVDHEVFLEKADKDRTRVSSHLKGTSALNLQTKDDDSASNKEGAPA